MTENNEEKVGCGAGCCERGEYPSTPLILGPDDAPFVANVTIQQVHTDGLEGDLLDVLLNWSSGKIGRQFIVSLLVVNVSYAIVMGMGSLFIPIPEDVIGRNIGYIYAAMYCFVHVPVILVWGVHALEKWWERRGSD